MLPTMQFKIVLQKPESRLMIKYEHIPLSNYGVLLNSWKNWILKNMPIAFLLRNSPIFTILRQPAIACSKLTIETLEQYVKYVQN